ncbi:MULTISPECIES: hypothetical protein [unclassified Rhizobium]|jgi:hypothetical protein|uniref:hypothetical protein n=1 Tax=unclassified Rhizobium TaxID=2613769 RepID=UPI0006482BA5|nr:MULTISPECIES: hypothetical protein [unclassified Rhizobium]MBN8954310.1 hypothetical protein [Rhizobium tropici]OJY66512.1 MAG: hypothetical protein BGP09_31830 [Rhizobium sp. 60-20]RKD68905.1 hypothetical protein BJ928_10443 [Rhizobium sp. WW_1]
MYQKFGIAALALLVSSAQSYASSERAWDALFAKVNGTCIGMSRMNTPEVSAPIVFDDATGKVGLLLRGSIGKSKAAVQNVNLLCLYDKKTGKASIAEYKSMGK